MSKRDNSLLLQDILDAAHKIVSYTAGMSFEDFNMDSKTADAVIRNFEIIGEASNKLSEALRTDNPQIDWDRIRGFRNRIIHEYFGIDLEIVWNIIEDDIEELIEQIESILG